MKVRPYCSCKCLQILNFIFHLAIQLKGVYYSDLDIFHYLSIFRMSISISLFRVLKFTFFRNKCSYEKQQALKYIFSKKKIFQKKNKALKAPPKIGPPQGPFFIFFLITFLFTIQFQCFIAQNVGLGQYFKVTERYTKIFSKFMLEVVQTIIFDDFWGFFI